jgi:hypothetical protein
VVLVTDVWGAEPWCKSCVAQEASEKLGGGVEARMWCVLPPNYA